MFNQLYTLIKEANLLGLNLTIKPMADSQMSVVLNFMAGSVSNMKLFDEHKTNNEKIDKVIALQSALVTPLVVTGAPDVILEKLTQELRSIKSGLTEVVNTLNGLDLSALLSTASANAATVKDKAAPVKTAPAKSAPAKAAPIASDDEATDPESDSDEVTEAVEVASEAPTASFNDFDSL